MKFSPRTLGRSDRPSGPEEVAAAPELTDLPVADGRYGDLNVRLGVALRYFAIGAGLLAVVGLVAYYTGQPAMTATLGPTAYVFAAHPDSETARVRNAVGGHATAIAAGLACLGIFGLWNHPSVSVTGETGAQVAAGAVAVGATLAALELLKLHHAPAAATALLVSLGYARPDKPLLGLGIGLILVIVLGPLAGRRPGGLSRPPTLRRGGALREPGDGG